MRGERVVEGLRIVLHWNYFHKFDTIILVTNYYGKRKWNNNDNFWEVKSEFEEMAAIIKEL